MSAGSFILLMLIMWAVVAAFYTTIFLVGPGKEGEAPRRPAETEKPKPSTGHEMPHAA